MNTFFKHKILVGAILCSALFMVSSCHEDENLPAAPEKKLYEMMTSDEDLTDFMEVINLCGKDCADSLFNTSRVYTVWAPINGSFDKEALRKQIEDGGRDLVFKRFVLAHIANYLRPANGTVDNKKILLLNDKVATFNGNTKDGYTFDGQVVEQQNIRAWNGILHKLNSPSEYKYNIWEYLSTDSRVDSVRSFLYKFDETKFSAAHSVMGPIVNGEQTYLDSVFITSNVMQNSWTGVGQLNNEDSTYTVYVPSNEVWDEVKALAEKHFNYNQHSRPVSIPIEERDSLRALYSRINILKYMTYSDNEQRYVENEDCAMPAWLGTSVFVERPEFPKARLEENVIFTETLSNGTFKIINKLPYNQFELWHDTIKVEGENDGLRSTDPTGGVVSPQYVSKSDIEEEIANDPTLLGAEISGGTYLLCNSERADANLAYKLPDVLSASYQVALVIVPKGFPNHDKENALKNNFAVTIEQTFGEGSKKTLYTKTGINNDPTRLDTLFLRDNNGDTAVINIPYCEYYKTASYDDYNLLLKIGTQGGYKNFDKSIRLDAIILVPVKDVEE